MNISSPSCSSQVSTFISDCTLTELTSKSFKSLAYNTFSGYCPSLFARSLGSCLTENYHAFSDQDSFWNCYTKEGISECLPASIDYPMNSSALCRSFSFLQFTLNNLATFLKEGKKVTAIIATQIFRALEVKHCLPTCNNQDYKLIGPKETSYEVSRYVQGYAALYVKNLGFFQPYPFIIISGILINWVRKFLDVLQALPQQYARNQDSLQRIQTCKEKPSQLHTFFTAANDFVKNTTASAMDHTYQKVSNWVNELDKTALLYQGIHLINKTVGGVIYVCEQTFNLANATWQWVNDESLSSPVSSPLNRTNAKRSSFEKLRFNANQLGDSLQPKNTSDQDSFISPNLIKETLNTLNEGLENVGYTLVDSDEPLSTA